jgi:hypothetical protein
LLGEIVSHILDGGQVIQAEILVPKNLICLISFEFLKPLLNLEEALKSIGKFKAGGER